ncbi:SAM-dependent methyltransferase [Ferdinandcohnia sp. Marseille-Q9671]
MNDYYTDALLHVKTSGGQKGFSSSVHNHRYEPTPYEGLDALFKQYQVKSDDRVVDFGCGKGRLLFYIHHFFSVSVVGIEVEKSLFQDALDNRDRYLKKTGARKEEINIHHCKAQDYRIHPLDNRFYFFNPFSIQVFKHIINNIVRSLQQNPREIEIILYYGSADYTYFLENHTAFQFKKEIIIPGLYERNSYERFLVYHIS